MITNQDEIAQAIMQACIYGNRLGNIIKEIKPIVSDIDTIMAVVNNLTDDGLLQKDEVDNGVPYYIFIKPVAFIVAVTPNKVYEPQRVTARYNMTYNYTNELGSFIGNYDEVTDHGDITLYPFKHDQSARYAYLALQKMARSNSVL